MAEGHMMGPWAHHLRRINLENQYYESNTVLPISYSGRDAAFHRAAQAADAKLASAEETAAGAASRSGHKRKKKKK